MSESKLNVYAFVMSIFIVYGSRINTGI